MLHPTEMKQKVVEDEDELGWLIIIGCTVTGEVRTTPLGASNRLVMLIKFKRLEPKIA